MVLLEIPIERFIMYHHGDRVRLSSSGEIDDAGMVGKLWHHRQKYLKQSNKAILHTNKRPFHEPVNEPTL